MSIANIELVTQPSQAGVTTHAPDAINSINTIVVNREKLIEAYNDANHVSRCLHNIEDPSELHYSDLAHLCRTIYHVAELLDGMLKPKGEA